MLVLILINKNKSSQHQYAFLWWTLIVWWAIMAVLFVPNWKGLINIDLFMVLNEFRYFWLEKGGLAYDRCLRAISDHDLRWVLVGHYNGGRGQSVAESIRVVGLQGLSDHSGVMVVSDLEHVTNNDDQISLTESLMITCLVYVLFRGHPEMGFWMASTQRRRLTWGQSCMRRSWYLRKQD